MSALVPGWSVAPCSSGEAVHWVTPITFDKARASISGWWEPQQTHTRLECPRYSIRISRGSRLRGSPGSLSSVEKHMLLKVRIYGTIGPDLRNGMRWLLQDVVRLATDPSQAPDSLIGRDDRLVPGGLASAMADAASSFVSSASDAASELASEVGSTVAANVVEVSASQGPSPPCHVLLQTVMKLYFEYRSFPAHLIT